MKALITNRLIKGLFVILLVAGCAGLEKPQGLKDDLAYTVATWKAVTLSATDLCSRKVLSVDQCNQAEDFSKQTETAVKLSQAALSNGDNATAQTQYQIAAKALLALQKIVAASDQKSELTVEGILV